eukprot:m.364834 g.364834  ORF g.364834 m.364834 type:complete len:76 (+) comp28080_c0_seq29:1797-2024(+)
MATLVPPPSARATPSAVDKAVATAATRVADHGRTMICGRVVRGQSPDAASPRRDRDVSSTKFNQVQPTTQTVTLV